MLRPTPGPDAPPPGARTCRLRDWGGGDGTFWQLGDTIGVVYDRMPDFGENATRGILPAAHWVIPDGEVFARDYFDQMKEAQEWNLSA